jgi:hypothetical protein
MPGLPDRNGDGFTNWLWTPDVNGINIDTSRGARALYHFNSSRPGTSPSHGRICGAAFEYYDTLLSEYTFRTEVLTFPLFPLKQDSSLRALAGDVLDYILGATPTDVGDDGSVIRPDRPGLELNYPNPFNAQTSIRYTVETKQHVTLQIYNLLGQRVVTLVNGVIAPGSHEVKWNGRDELRQEVGSGVYFYRLELADHTETRKMLLLK